MPDKQSIEELVAVHTESAAETQDLGARIGQALGPGMVLALIGDLGAGKTTLTKGIALGLGVTGLVHSPTFTLIHEHAGKIPVYHIDLYRTERPEEIEELGYEDYFYGGGVTVIEWAEKIERLLPADRLEIRMTGEDEHRTIEFRATGPNSVKALDAASLLK